MDYRKEPCIIDECPNRGRKLKPYCATCSGGMRYAMSKDDPIAYVAERQKKLTKFQSRMVYLGAKDKTYAKAKRIIEAAHAAPLDSRAARQIQAEHSRKARRKAPRPRRTIRRRAKAA